MKKCPTCGKTFDDNLKFCQTDGTALIEDAPPPDPYQTVVIKPEDIGAPVPIEPITPSTKAENVDDIVLDIPEDKAEEDDPLKTMVSSGAPFDEDDDLMKTAVVSEAERKEIFGEKPETNVPPPSPFGGSSTESSSAAPPEIPKFNEPDLSPPSFGDLGSSSPMKEEPPPISPPSEPPPPPTFEPPQNPSVPPNTPIPSPFDESMPPGYQTPSTPPFKEPEAKLNEPSTPFGGSPFGQQKPVNNNMQQQNQQFNPPNQQFNQPPATGGGQNQTLAIVSLVLGILGFVCLGFIGGIGAIITGFIARKKATENPAQYGGAGLALAGMIIGALATLVSFGVLIIYAYMIANGGHL